MMSTPSATAVAAPISLTVAPVAYWWPRRQLMDFYANVAEGPASTVVLGEVTCSRRHDWTLEDWLALARDLRAAGKQVRLATLPLLMDEPEQRAMHRLVDQDEFEVEAGDASAVAALALACELAPHRPGFHLGPHVNVYNLDSLSEWAQDGCRGWVLPAELPLSVVPAIRRGAPELPVEVFAFGRLPLAFSARCFTARHHHRRKDDCQYLCQQDADGLLLHTQEGDPFLALNGTQVQSAALHCLLGELDRLPGHQVQRLRMQPCSRHFQEVTLLFDAVLQQRLDIPGALREIARLDLPGVLVDGYAQGRAGMSAVAPMRLAEGV